MKDACHKHLKELTVTVKLFLDALDAEMKKPAPKTPTEAYQLGARIAQICNALEMANDRARHFGLGIELKPKGK